MVITFALLASICMSIVYPASIKPRNSRICPDGKTSPLLYPPKYSNNSVKFRMEGEDNIFPCIYDCPNGFICENQDSSSDGGICCPDLDLLYEIYGDKEEETKITDQTDDVFDIPNVPDVPVVIVDQKESVKGLLLEGSQKISNTEQEIRRAPPTTPTSIFTSTIAQTTKNFTIVTLSATLSKVVTPITPIPTIYQPAGIIELNCRRQQLQHTCNGGTQTTQYVVRWYKHNGACHHYIYGFCPGTRIDNDQTLRTKDDCEALCLKLQESDLFKFLSTNSDDKTDLSSLRNHGVPLAKSVETIESISNDDELPRASEIVSFKSSNDSPMDISDQFIHAETTLAPRKRCARVPYRTICPDTGLPSQIIIRWYSKDGNCEAYGFGYCHGELVLDNESLKTEEECLRYCPGISQTDVDRFDFPDRLI